MVVAVAERVPTMEDAHRAAAALAEMDPGMVLLYGSVARGTQNAESDLELCLVFDDLGDYSQRCDLERKASRLIREATGFYADVKVTDRPEWRIRSVECLSTLERHIAGHAVTLVERPPRLRVDYSKEIGMAPSDAAQAENTLWSVGHALRSLYQQMLAGEAEAEAMAVGDRRLALLHRQTRMLNICADSQSAMETALKALTHALRGPHPEKSHNIGGLIRGAANAGLSAAEEATLVQALGSIAPEDASRWREAATFPGEPKQEPYVAMATPQFAAAMASAAAIIARECAILIVAELGENTTNRDEVRRMSQKVAARTHLIDPPSTE